MKRLWQGVWPLGIRTQLTLWYIIVFAILIFLLGTVFYVNLRTSLVRSLDSALQYRTQEIASGISIKNGKIAIQDVTGELPGSIDSDSVQDGTSGSQEPQPDVDIGTLVRIIDDHGQTVYITPAFQSLNVPTVSITQALQARPWQGTVSARNGHPVLLLSAPLANKGRIFGVVQVGEPLSVLNNTLQSVLFDFFVIVPFFLLFSAVGSYWLATRAFASMNRLTSAAQDIKVGDLHQRVPVPRARDEVQRLALTFNEMIERLDKAFTQQRRFVADASHELRTPVAAICSVTDVVLAQNATPEEYVAALRNVNIEAERLRHLISDLLALARADEGQTLFEREPVRLDLLVIDVAATTEALAAERGIIVEINSQEPAVVLGDEARLIQVILNLLDNALAYTDAGGKITLSVEVKNENVCLTVRDMGIGIATKHLEHIFERFYRTDPARSRARGGSGLGLAIAEWVVRAHEGTISVESQVGKGSAFSVTLPLARHDL